MSSVQEAMLSKFLTQSLTASSSVHLNRQFRRRYVVAVKLHQPEQENQQVTSNMIEYEIISRFRVKVVIGYINYSYWLKGSCQLQLTSPPADDLLSRKYTLQKYDEECMMGDIYINIDI
ncbi:hypothetical protein AtNW77_Chr5g0141661 [Arabidopsis thaliana]